MHLISEPMQKSEKKPNQTYPSAPNPPCSSIHVVLYIHLFTESGEQMGYERDAFRCPGLVAVVVFFSVLELFVTKEKREIVNRTARDVPVL